MQIKYFRTAWNDIKNSPGWLGKIAILALLQIVPIFGQIVLFGYVYGWARDIAWGVHAPLGQHIFGNEDGKLYSRGFFILVIAFVFSLVPGVISTISSAIIGGGVGMSLQVNSYAPSAFALTLAGILGLVATAASLLVALLINVANMRCAIYDRIGPGFQIKKIWAMFRHDTNGMLRIFGMTLLIAIVGGIVLSIIAAILVFIVAVPAVPGLMDLDRYANPSPGQVLGVLGPFLSAFFIAFSVWGFLVSMLTVFVYMMTARASGYWTRQFDVAHWRGQDDPMPFELYATQQTQSYSAAQAQYAQARAEYVQAQAQSMHAQGQQIAYQHQQAQQAYAQAQQAPTQAQPPASAQPFTPAQPSAQQTPAQPPAQYAAEGLGADSPDPLGDSVSPATSVSDNAPSASADSPSESPSASAPKD